MIELTLALHSEQKVLRFMQRQAEAEHRRKPTSVSLKALQGYSDCLSVEFINASVFALQQGVIAPGARIGIDDLRALGLNKILVRWDNNRKVNQLLIR